MDADAVRARAREVAALADEVRAVAAWARRAADADWESVAAEAFRAQLHAEIERVLAAAGAVISTYHYLVEWFPSLEGSGVCAVSVPCTVPLMCQP